MPVIIACRSCGRRLRVAEDQLGRKVRCPGCKDVFVAEEVDNEAAEGIGTAPSSPSGTGSGRYPARRQEEDDRRRDYDVRRRREEEEEEEEEEDYSRVRRRKSSSAAGWRKIRLALALYVAAILTWGIGGIVVAALGAALFGTIVQATNSMSGVGAGVMAAATLGCLHRLISGGLWIGAHCLFFMVPDKPGTGLRGLGITTAILGIAIVAFDVLAMLVSMAEVGSMALTGRLYMGSTAGNMVGLLSFLCMLGHIPVAIFFLRAIALEMKRKDLARHLVMWLIWFGILILTSIVLTVVLCGIGMIIGASMMNAFSSAGTGSGSTGSAAGTAMGGFALMFYISCATMLLLSLALLALYIWYVILVFQLRNAVDYKLRH
jgi:predicted Zn finger-like uncharacterized protein